MIKQERRTVVKKMSNKDLLNILWLLENCKDVSDVDLTKLPDLSNVKQDNLNIINKQSFRLTDNQKQIFDKYFYEKPYSYNYKEFLNVMLTSDMSAPDTTVATTTVTTTNISNTKTSTPVSTITTPTDTVHISNYLYDPSAPVEVPNFNASLCLNDVVEGKITDKDVCDMFGTKYNRLMSIRPDQFKDLPNYYLQDLDFAGCLMTAVQKAGQLKAYLEMPEPSMEETIDRFVTYLRRNITAPVQTIDSVDFADEIRVEDDRIKFADCDGALGETVYTNKKDMTNDVLYYGLSFNFDLDTPFTILGKQHTLRSIVKDYYKKYPNGFNTDFFKSAREAYGMGKLEL